LKHKVVPSKPTELEAFASFFHQDWRLMYPNFHAGAKLYIGSLSNESKRKLRAELLNFIAGRSARSTRKRWIALGAQAWDPDLEIVATLKSFADMINVST